MEHKSRILDCTLRDGGYYNKWNFSRTFLYDYLKLMSIFEVDWVEIGFRKNIVNKTYGDFVRSDDGFLDKIHVPKNLRLCVMIDLSDFKTINDIKRLKKNFKQSEKSKVSMVRIATSFEDLIYLSSVVKILKKKNYIVCVNLMKFTLLKNKQLIFFFKKALNIGCDFFYLADSFGNLRPNKIKKICLELKKNNIDLSKFGYHGHNNLNLAFKNAKKFEEKKFGLIDTSITGMGRGAGNLLFEEYAKKRYPKNKIILVKRFILKHMEELKKKYRWGPSFHYQYSAKNNIHPTYVQNLLSEKKFSFKQIYKILKFLKLNNSKTFDTNIFDNLFLKTNSFKNKPFHMKKDKIILLCNNSQIRLINKKSLANLQIASLNINQFINKKYYNYLFLCHPYRLMTEVKTILNLKKKLVVPNYEILKTLISKKNEIINYNYIFHKNNVIKDKFCGYNKNLVIVYAISFCIKEKIKEIVIYGLSQNNENINIIKKFNKFIKDKKLRTKIILK